MNFKIGTFFNVPLYINFSAFLMLGLAFLAAGPIGFCFSALGYFFVVLHEYGHVCMAQYFGWAVYDVTIYFMGGIANMTIRCNPKEEICVGAAGPVVSFALFALFMPFCLIFLIFDLPGMLFVFGLFAVVNLIIFTFNLLPLLPMDGGRILRASLASIIDYEDATWWSVRIGQIVGVLAVALALLFGAYAAAVVLSFMILAASMELDNAKTVSVLLKIRNTVALVLNKPELGNATVPQLVLALEATDSEVRQQLNLDESLAILKKAEDVTI